VRSKVQVNWVDETTTSLRDPMVVLPVLLRYARAPDRKLVPWIVTLFTPSLVPVFGVMLVIVGGDPGVGVVGVKIVNPFISV
jgi:hypothetical protein